MPRFLFKVALFLLVIVLSLAGSVFFVPSAEMKSSLLRMAPVKVARLRATPSPKIILVGGSNLSMGINSQPIEETFGKPVVNMGLHGGLGLAYMMAEVKPDVQTNDILVLVPEYSQLYSDNYWGNIELLGVAFDIMPEKRKSVTPEQWLHLAHFVPVYAAKKLLNIVPSWFKKKNAFYEEYNRYGDMISHWNAPDSCVVPQTPCKEPVAFDFYYLDHFEMFVRDMQRKGVRVLILPPCFQASSFDNIKPLITTIESELRRRGLPLIAPTSRYRMDDALCSGTPYHLNKRGVDKRTSLLIQDLSEALTNAYR